MANPNTWLDAQLYNPDAQLALRHLNHPSRRQSHRIRQAKILLKVLHAATNPCIHGIDQLEAAMHLRALASKQNGLDAECGSNNIDSVPTPYGKSWQD